jgi:hypothetical protein
MIYKFSEFLRLDYSALADFLNDEEELYKDEILERCTGEIDYHVLQSLKELQFKKIGKTPKGEIYLL